MPDPVRCFFVVSDAAPDTPGGPYHRTDTGEVYAHLADVPPGGMWYATWMDGVRGGWLFDGKGGPDGHVLVVRLPNRHDWVVDSRCSNCSLPQDDVHRCWVRTGTPPEITVGKDGGPTCPAGGGSIQSGDYHGFLKHGELISC